MRPQRPAGTDLCKQGDRDSQSPIATMAGMGFVRGSVQRVVTKKQWRWFKQAAYTPSARVLRYLWTKRLWRAFSKHWRHSVEAPHPYGALQSIASVDTPNPRTVRGNKQKHEAIKRREFPVILNRQDSIRLMRHEVRSSHQAGA
jgi:hypothetical protein